MPKFIRDWNDLLGLESEHYRLEIDVGAAVIYALNKDFKMSLYWIAAAVLNFCVTF